MIFLYQALSIWISIGGGNFIGCKGAFLTLATIIYYWPGFIYNTCFPLPL
jgi:hypothetical protein